MLSFKHGLKLKKGGNRYCPGPRPDICRSRKNKQTCTNDYTINMFHSLYPFYFTNKEKKIAYSTLKFKITHKYKIKIRIANWSGSTISDKAFKLLNTQRKGFH